MAAELARFQEISVRLDGIRGSIKRLFLIDGVARLLLAIGLFVVATFVLDYVFILPSAIRLLFLIGGVAGFSWVAAKRIAYPMGVKISDDDLAIFVERHFPELKDRLISALQLARATPDSSDRSAGFNSPELVDALINDALQATSQLDFKSVVISQHVMKIAMWAGILLLVLGTGAIASPKLASIYGKRALGGYTRWPQRTYLKILGFENNRRVVARGDDLTIAVSSEGRKPTKVRLSYQFESGERGRETLGETIGEGGKPVWAFTFMRVSGNFTFTVEGGDDTSDVQNVLTQNPPAVEEMKLFLDYPDYLGIEDTPADRPEINPNLQVPLFTRVRGIAISNEPLKHALVRIGQKEGGSTATVQPEADAKGVKRIIPFSFDVTESYTEYQLTLVAENELTNRDPLIYIVKGAIDNKPMITVLDPAGEETATELCERPIVIDTKDDHGLREIAVEVKIVGAKSTDWQHTVLTKDHNRPAEYTMRQDHIRSEYLLKISELGVKPGEFVVMRIHAEDWKNIGGANTVKSKEYKFTIVAITVLEKELQDAIDKIKRTLDDLRRRQETGYKRVGDLDRKVGGVDAKLSSDQSGEVKSAGLEQNDITSKLDGSRKDIERVMRRGLYNKIFDEHAAEELGKSVTILKQLADTSDPARPGTSAVAASWITQAARAAKSKDRRDQFSEAQSLQSAVIKGIQDALRYLDRWSNYQEIVRMTREILEAQKDINKTIPGLDK